MHFHNQEFVRAISPVEGGLALTVEAVDGENVETPLPLVVLESADAAGRIAQGHTA